MFEIIPVGIVTYMFTANGNIFYDLSIRFPYDTYYNVQIWFDFDKIIVIWW